MLMVTGGLHLKKMNPMTEPLTPADCDLQNLPYMPLDVRRLRDSDLASTESPEACWAAVLLWAASWHQVPAASLPDDDRVLSNLAGYGRVVKEWQRVKDGALRGWVKCNDGRLYHPVVAEKANESWASKLAHAHGKLKERLRKSYGKDAVFPSYEAWIFAGRPNDWAQSSAGKDESSAGKDESSAGKDESSAGKDESSAGIPPETALKGNGKGKGYVKEEIQGRTHTVLVHDAPVCVEAQKPLEPRSSNPTAAGAACLAMRAEGIADVNPSSPKLAALLAAGATNAELAAAAKGAVDRGKGFAYALGTVQRQREEAASMATTLHKGPTLNRADALRSKNHAAMKDWLAAQESHDATS